MIYVSNIFGSIGRHPRWPYANHAYLWADGIGELHDAAADLGLRRHWFHDGRHPHYDLTANKRRSALRLGAEPITARDFIRRKRVCAGR